MLMRIVENAIDFLGRTPRTFPNTFLVEWLQRKALHLTSSSSTCYVLLNECVSNDVQCNSYAFFISHSSSCKSRSGLKETGQGLLMYFMGTTVYPTCYVSFQRRSWRSFGHKQTQYISRQNLLSSRVSEEDSVFK